MLNDKLSSAKTILAIVILVALGLVVYFIMPKNSLPVIVQPTPSPTITPTLTVTPTVTPTAIITSIPTPNIDISDWKTYKNDKYEFEFNYPKEWIIKQEMVIDLSKLGNDNIIKASGTEFWLIFGNNNSTLEFFSLQVMNKSIKDAINFDATSFGKKTGEPVVIGGLVGEKLKGAFYGMQYVVNNGKTYFFEQINADEIERARYDRVISTFKFIK